MNLFRKIDNIRCDKIISNLKLSLFYGTIGKEIVYPDSITKLPILTIRLTKNDVKFILDPNKKEYFNNIGLNDLKKEERIIIYTKIEEYMIGEREKYIEDIKNRLLKKYGFIEDEFCFLIKHCKEKGGL